jgi:hypothetical protein
MSRDSIVRHLLLAVQFVIMLGSENSGLNFNYNLTCIQSQAGANVINFVQDYLHLAWWDTYETKYEIIGWTM